ncbi:MAG: LptF/LptG family permease, partial [Planctomycetota bacterium]
LKKSLIPADVEAQKEDVVYMTLEQLSRKTEDSVDRRWVVKYYARFATPLSALVLLFIGLPLVSRFGTRNIFLGALLAAICSCAYLVAGSVFTNIAIRGFLPSALGAWLAPLMFTALGVTWFRFLRA